jgi:hypothetical protein
VGVQRAEIIMSSLPFRPNRLTVGHGERVRPAELCRRYVACPTICDNAPISVADQGDQRVENMDTSLAFEVRLRR